MRPAIWSRSRGRGANNGLERMELDLSLCLGHNGARRSRPSSRSWPQWSLPISATVLAWVCWLIGGFGEFFDGSGGHVLEFLWVLSPSSCYEEMFLIGGVVVAWLCRSLVVGSGFDCVGLGLVVLIWVCCDWFLDLCLI